MELVAKSAINEMVEPRTIERTVLSESGKLTYIYKVENLTFEPRLLHEGRKYVIRYFSERKTNKITAVYYGATEDFRTLIVSSPYSNGSITLGIPSYNIYSIEPFVK
jgi:hypothetical protein